MVKIRYSSKSDISIFNCRPYNSFATGWDLDVVWTLDRLSEAHKFLHTEVRGNTREETNADFESPASMRAKLWPYYMGGSSQPGKYAYSVKLCGPDFFVEEVGKEGQHMVDPLEFFDGKTYTSSWARKAAWRQAQDLAVVNICQFVC